MIIAVESAASDPVFKPVTTKTESSSSLSSTLSWTSPVLVAPAAIEDAEIFVTSGAALFTIVIV